MLPFLAPLLPLSVGYALIRHNVLATSAVLTRRMFVVPVLTGALVVAIIAWLALRAAVHSADLGARSSPGSGAAVALVRADRGRRARRRRGCSSRRRPGSARRCSSSPTTSRRRGTSPDIGRAIQAAVMRWLPTEHAEVLAPADLDRLPHRPRA